MHLPILKLALSALALLAMCGAGAVAKEVTDVYANRSMVCQDDGTVVRLTFGGSGQPFQVTWVRVGGYKDIPAYSGPPLTQTVSDRPFNQYRGYLVANWYPPRPLRHLVNRVRLRDISEMQLPMGQWGGGWPSFRILPCR